LANDEKLYGKYSSDLSESKLLVVQENKFVLCFIVDSGCLDLMVPKSTYAENQVDVAKWIQIANGNFINTVCKGEIPCKHDRDFLSHYLGRVLVVPSLNSPFSLVLSLKRAVICTRLLVILLSCMFVQHYGQRIFMR
jgi:hypothetical protein